jgi:type I restriction enzyme S subunit
VISQVDTFVEDNANAVISKGNEVLVPSSGETEEDISRASVIEQAGVILGGDLNIIYPKNEIDSVFLALSISHGSPQREMMKRAQGKTVVHLHNSDLKTINLLYPQKEEQTAIGSFFRNFDDLIEAQRQEIEKLQNIKNACINKMFV